MSKPTALITGASAGIGRAIATTLAAEGYRLILMARREEKLLALQEQLKDTPCHLIAADVRDQAAVSTALSELPTDFAEIDVLINNAGLALGLAPADQTDWQDWQTMIDTNCTALAYLTRQVLPGMRQRNRGIIINMGSTAGTYAYPGVNMYGASKAFVEHFSLALRADLLGTNVRVCNLEPGLVSGTEFSNIRFDGDDQRAAEMYTNCEPLLPEDVAEAVRWVVSQPQRVNINRMEMMPVCQAPAGLSVAKKE